MGTALFLAVFAVYLAGLPPALAPWRDTGELTLAASTLGVAHPPSYPLYVLLGNLGLRVPLANPALRLNLLSAAALAAAVALLFAETRRRFGLFAALAAALLLAGNASAIAVGQVSEMYAPWVLSGVALLALARRLSEGEEWLWPGFCFAAGLALANRLDLLLWAPGLAWLALSKHAPERENLPWGLAAFVLVPAVVAFTGANWPVAALAFGTFLWRARGPRLHALSRPAILWGAVGLSLYLYLPVRSFSQPFLDWNHPASFPNLVDSILRTRYGGTLDLVSKNYELGECFADNLRLWGVHLWDAFGPLGLLAAVAGMLAAFRDRRAAFLGEACAGWWSGPVFLFLANMPPNPHAVAIVEPHRLLADVLLAAWAGEGVAWLAASRAVLAPVFAAAALLWPLWQKVPQRMDRRWALRDYDYAHAVLDHAPKGAVIVAKKDVQLYALWHHQALHAWRPDVAVLAQGLAGSPWYQADWRRRDPSLTLARLTEPAGWGVLAASGRPLYATQDAELPGEVGALARPNGLLQAVSPAAPEDAAAMFALLPRRGVMRYDAAEDFFAGDLIDSHAAAAYRYGLKLHASGKPEAAAAMLHDAWLMEWEFPELPGFLGYMAASNGKWDEAALHYGLADQLYAHKLQLAAEYRALPDLIASIRRQAAENATSLGAAKEKKGDRDGAAAAYGRALALFPLAQTFYNRAVLSWGKDWASTQSDLEQAVRLDPGHAEARKFLGMLRARPK